MIDSLGWRTGHWTFRFVIITKDEASNIAGALESVAWANDVVVVDSGSTDDTVAIARRTPTASPRHESGRVRMHRRTTRPGWQRTTGCCRSMPTSGFSS